ncbi:hypothetical protein ASE01_21780 [Nocardioides sp. Root190]|nr:hypothetical protein ASE01_21780 [Nocardioides sp. Root190]
MEPYESLRDRWLDKPDCEEIAAASGTVYQVEIEAFWDGPKALNGNLRVWVSAGSWLMPPTESFIIAPDGSFIGE